MRPIPGSLKKVFFALAILIGIVTLGVVFFMFQLLADTSMAEIELPNDVDGKEAKRKLGVFEDAQKESKHGYIRLTEVEINSYLKERFALDSDQNKTNAPANTCHLLKCTLDLKEKGIKFYCKVRKQWLGHSWEIVCQREGTIKRVKTRWTFDLQSMYVGRQKISPYWQPTVQEFLRDVDQVFAAPLKQFGELPNLKLVTPEFAKSPQLWLYTYSETDLTHDAAK